MADKSPFGVVAVGGETSNSYTSTVDILADRSGKESIDVEVDNKVFRSFKNVIYYQA